MFLFLFINYRPKKIKNKIDESNDLEVDTLSTEVSKVSNELAAIMDDFVNITIGKKYAYKIKIDKTSHDPNGPNAFPIKIIDKQTNTEVKQLDCCTSRLSASKSSESVANIFDNFLTTKSSTTTTTSKSKKLGIKIIKKKGKEEEEEEEDKIIKNIGDNVNNNTAKIPKEDNNIVDNHEPSAAAKASNPPAAAAVSSVVDVPTTLPTTADEDLEKMSISSEDFNEIFQEEINEINHPTTTTNIMMDNVSNNTTGNK